MTCTGNFETRFKLAGLKKYIRWVYFLNMFGKQCYFYCHWLFSLELFFIIGVLLPSCEKWSSFHLSQLPAALQTWQTAHLSVYIIHACFSYIWFVNCMYIVGLCFLNLCRKPFSRAWTEKDCFFVLLIYACRTAHARCGEHETLKVVHRVI